MRELWVTYAVTHFIYLVGKRVVAFPFGITEHFVLALDSDVISRYWSKSAFFKAGGSL